MTLIVYSESGPSPSDSVIVTITPSTTTTTTTTTSTTTTSPTTTTTPAEDWRIVESLEKVIAKLLVLLGMVLDLGERDNWLLVSERVLRIKGKPGKMALLTMSMVFLAEFVSVLGLWSAGRLDVNLLLDVNFILSNIAAALFFGLFGWGALFLKKAYYTTIDQLTFKDDDVRESFLTRDAVYSTTYAGLGVIIVIIALGAALSVWPLITMFFIPALTLNLIPFLIVVLFLMILVSLLGVDLMGAIPRLLTVPSRLKDHLQITLLRPDRCGGAKAIGDFYFIFTILAATTGSITIVISSSFQQVIVGYVLSAAFLLLALCVFLIPQMSIRAILRGEKLKRLEEISERVEILSKDYDSLESDEMMVSFLQVQSLIMLYHEVEKLREFPFETGTLQKVVTTALLPLIFQIIFVFFNIT